MTWRATSRRFGDVMAITNGTSNADRLTGTNGNDILLGLDGNDTLFGLLGHDRLDGGLGFDTMSGGAGNDAYDVYGALDRVIESAGGGVDDVFSSLTFTLGPNVENLQLTGAAAINGTGNAGHNILRGNNAANTLLGLAGNDKFYGGGGNDVQSGGNDHDRLWGMSGDDSLFGDNGNDRLFGEGGRDNLQGGSGVDHLYSGDGDDFLHGGNDNDFLYAERGHDRLFGGNGNDRLFGGAGNDELRGALGADHVSGETGQDFFVYFSVGESPYRTSLTVSDTILDFRHSESDKIHLFAIDAIESGGRFTDDAFTFIGTSAFTGLGQLRYFAGSTATIVEGNISGDITPEFRLILTGSLTLAASDFVL